MKQYPIISGLYNNKKEEELLCSIGTVRIGDFFSIPGNNYCIYLKISENKGILFKEKRHPSLIDLKDIDKIYRENVDIYILDDTIDNDEKEEGYIHSFIMDKNTLYYKIQMCNKSTKEFYTYKVMISQNVKGMISFFSNKTSVSVLLNVI